MSLARYWFCLLLAACANRTAPPQQTPRRGAEELVARVLKVYPHDPAAYTQGLVYFDRDLFESTGQFGSSSLRRVDPDSGAVEAGVSLDSSLFGEGLARVGDELIQLTWKNRRALVYKLSSLERLREHSYQGEGWGLCFDGKRLVMSDGSERLTFRDPQGFAEKGSIRVTRDGQPVQALNELECVEGAIYANIWHSDNIVRIDTASGEVTGWIDASGLLPPDQRANTEAVLNGIAYVPERNTFLLTGKLWPSLFEVKFVAREQDSKREPR